MSQPSRQQQILFVDDEKYFLEIIRPLFTDWSQNSWQIEVATSPDQALEILKTRPIDLIVVDVNMPVLDGGQFLTLLSRRYPALKKAALTALATDEKRTTCLTNGAELFIEKPSTLEGLKSAFAMLDELVSWKTQTGFQGMLRQVGLQDVIQMECLGRNSSILEVNDQSVSGRIYIQDGRLIHAVSGSLMGEAAFQKLLSLPGGAFQLQPFAAPLARTLDGPWEFLLLEAARVRDESAPQSPEPAQGQESPPENAPALRLIETLICSGQGAPLYQWQCPDAASRVKLLQAISHSATQLGQLLPLGNFNRVELQCQNSRTVARTAPDRLIFVQVAAENAMPLL